MAAPDDERDPRSEITARDLLARMDRLDDKIDANAREQRARTDKFFFATLTAIGLATAVIVAATQFLG